MEALIPSHALHPTYFDRLLGWMELVPWLPLQGQALTLGRRVHSRSKSHRLNHRDCTRMRLTLSTPIHQGSGWRRMKTRGHGRRNECMREEKGMVVGKKGMEDGPSLGLCKIRSAQRCASRMHGSRSPAYYGLEARICHGDHWPTSILVSWHRGKHGTIPQRMRPWGSNTSTNMPLARHPPTAE